MALTEAELKRERLRNVQFTRTQADLERAQADRTRYQRETVILQVQRDELAAEKSQLQQVLGDKSKAYDSAAQECDRLSQALSEETGKLQEAEKRIKELSTQLRRSEDARAKTQRSLVDLADIRRQLDRDLFRSQSEVLDFRQSLKREQTASRVRLVMQKAVLRRVLFVLWVLRSFSRHLGNRIARQHGTINALKIQFKVLRNARIDASREATLYQRRNGELVAQVEFLGGEADRWRIRCNEHRVKRHAAARQFTQFLILVASRRSTANSRLITGLLTLWRLNLILTERLARATRRVRTLNRWPALGGALDLSENGTRRMEAGTQCDGDFFASEASAAQSNEATSPHAERSELGAEWTWNELLPVSTVNGPQRSDAAVQWEGPRGRPVHSHASTQCEILETPPSARLADAGVQCEISHPHDSKPTQLPIESVETPIATLRTVLSPALSDSSSVAGTDDNNIDDLYEDLAGLDNPPLMTFGSLQDIGAVEVSVDANEILDSLETISSFSPNGPLSTIAEEEELAMSEIGSVRSSVRSRNTSAVDPVTVDLWHRLHSGVANFDAEVDAAFEDAPMTTPVNGYPSSIPNDSGSTPIRLVPRQDPHSYDTPRVILVQKGIQTDGLSEPEVPSVLTARLQQLWERIEVMQHWSQEYRSLALIHTHPTVSPPDIVFGSNMVLPTQVNPGSTFDEASEPPRIWPKTSAPVKDDDHPIGAHLAGDPKRSLRSSIYAQ